MTPRTSQRGRRGAALVEFALTLPVIALLLAAVVDWGAYMSLRTSVARAASDGARRGAAVFEPSDVDQGSLVVPAAEERARLVLLEMGLDCAGTCGVVGQYCATDEADDCASPPLDAILLRVDYPYEPLFGFAGTPTMITERSMFVVEGQ